MFRQSEQRKEAKRKEELRTATRATTRTPIRATRACKKADDGPEMEEAEVWEEEPLLRECIKLSPINALPTDSFRGTLLDIQKYQVGLDTLDPS